MKKIILFVTTILMSTTAMADNNSNNGAGNIINDTTNSYSNSNNQSSQHSNANSSASSGGNSFSSSTNNSTKYPRQTASVYAPPVFAAGGNDSCLGAVSGGVSTGVFGAALGGSTTDDNCIRLKNSERLERLGHHKAAMYVLCQNAEVRAGMFYEKIVCPQDREKHTEVTEFTTDQSYPSQSARH